MGVSIIDVWHAGREAVLYTPVSIALTVAFGLLLGRILATPAKASVLILFGTAICGGSAIAAMARQGLVMTLFLLGTGLTREVLLRVGIRPLAQGIILWVIVSAAILAAITGEIIR